MAQELITFLAIIWCNLGISTTVTAQHFGVTNLLALDGAIYLLFQSIRSHHVPGATTFGCIPEGFEFQECLILQVSSFIKDDKRVFDGTKVINQILIHIGIMSLAVHAKL